MLTGSLLTGSLLTGSLLAAGSDFDGVQFAQCKPVRFDLVPCLAPVLCRAGNALRGLVCEDESLLGIQVRIGDRRTHDTDTDQDNL